MSTAFGYAIRAAVAVTVALASVSTAAHHAFSANFDVDRIVEVRGRVTDLQWQNPHVLLTLETEDGESWAVESQAKNILERTEIHADVLAVGTRVALAGYPARAGHGVFALNALLADGRELILRAGQPARFGGRQGSNPDAVLAGGVSADAAALAAGLFRVWSMQFAGEGRWRWPDAYPLTAAAAAARARFDPVRDFPLRNCAPKGMPWIMEQPFPISFTRSGSDVALRLEEGDVVRTIHMTESPPPDVGPTPHGYSYGRWDDGDLVVRTIAINARYLNATGIPLSPKVTTDERFSLAPDGSRLDYTLTITDPDTFTEPLTVERYWIWRPGAALKPYDCAPDDAAR
jgi:hypothetical protein